MFEIYSESMMISDKNDEHFASLCAGCASQHWPNQGTKACLHIIPIAIGTAGKLVSKSLFFIRKQARRLLVIFA
jgi:hypothetical protein